MSSVNTSFEQPKKISQDSINQFINQDLRTSIQDKKDNKNKFSQDNSLKLRQNAANIQYKTHKSIINKLYNQNKITKKLYLQKLQQIQSSYRFQIIQIQQIRQILLKNAERIQYMFKKTKQDMLLAEKYQNISQKQLLQRIFGKYDLNDKEKLPIIRQKSTGCYYNSLQQEIYQDLSSQQIKQSQCQFFSQPILSPNFLANANFKHLLQQYKQRQNVKDQIEHHFAIQMGMLPINISQKQQTPTINTSVIGINQFLITFFKFYAYYYKDDFLKLINMPYGYTPQKRLSFIQNNQQKTIEEDQQGMIYGLQTIINNEILDDFYQYYYQKVQNASQLRLNTINYDKIHNKAIFDAFNQALNYFRPYYQINGIPYPWNISQKDLTFYFIAQQNQI